MFRADRLLAQCRKLSQFGLVFTLFIFGLTPACKMLDDIKLDTDSPYETTTTESSRRSQSQSGPIRVYFTTPEKNPMGPGNPAEALAKLIDDTRETLDVCAYELDNQVIVDALTRAAKRGVKMRLVTETDYIEESGVHALRDAGVPVLDDQRDGALMHNKFMVFDHKAVWMGSMNFTENCAYKNNNVGVYFTDRKLAENYDTKFRWMFEKKKFGGAPSKSDRIPNPMLELSDGTKIENYFSTHDHPADHVIQEINQAKKSIHFLAFSFTHNDIGDAMLDAAKDGVEVGGVFEKTQVGGGHSEFDRMKDAKLKVYEDGNSRNMHHKAIIIDGSVVITGSFNFSSNADKTNDENLVIIRNKDIAMRFEEEYRKVMDQAKQVGSTK